MELTCQVSAWTLQKKRQVISGCDKPAVVKLLCLQRLKNSRVAGSVTTAVPDAFM